MDARLLAKYDLRVPRYTSYPTAPHFGPEVDAETYARWLQDIPVDEPLSLYVHIPFCHKLCWFCGCNTHVVNKPAPVDAYLEILYQEIDTVIGHLGTGRPVQHVHWGGGTPTILSPAQIVALSGRLQRDFRLVPGAEMAVEIDPRTLAEDTVAALAEAGISRASLGVQDVSEDVQRAVNRLQPFADTQRAAQRLRAAGIDAINVDIMYGLPRQTIQRMIDTVDAVLTLTPQRLALFGYAHVPWMKKHQNLIDAAELPGPRDRLTQAEAAHERLCAAGYVPIGLDHFAHPDDSLTRSQKDGRLHRNFQGYTDDTARVLIGFGASAIGALPQGYVQNATEMPDYRQRIKGGGLAAVEGIAIDDNDRLRRAVIERLMCDFSVDLEALCKLWGKAPSVFQTERDSLEPLIADGLIVCDGWKISVPEEARMFVRVVCAAFDTYLKVEPARHAKAV